jgi:alpha-ketoglutarate-dependent taurine dioxygenase
MIISQRVFKHLFVSKRRSFSSDPSAILRSLPWQFLRAADSSKYDPVTKQRSDVPFDVNTGKVQVLHISSDGKEKKEEVSIQSVSLDDDDDDDNDTNYNVLWSDGSSSRYPESWVLRQIDQWKENNNTNTATKNIDDRVFWSQITTEDVRSSSSKLSMDFPELIHHPTGMRRALESLYKYGILLVTGTPIDDHQGEGVAALGAALSGGQVKEEAASSLLANYRLGGKEIMLPHGTDGPLRTLYAGVWSTSTAGQADGASVADSAYGSDGLPLHTDATYLRDPPGLQIFTMKSRAPKGGESVFGDGFAIAERLRESNPLAFDVLSRTIRKCRCVDEETGWHLEASGPVIKVEHGRIVAIRHNDLDRLPDLPPRHVVEPEEIAKFYQELEEAHRAWDELISSDEFRLVIPLEPGETMVVANQVRHTSAALEQNS